VQRPRTWLIAAAALGLWLTAGFFLVPELLEAIYRSNAVPLLSQQPLSFFLEQWREIVLFGGAAAVAVALSMRALRDPTLSHRLVPDARPSDLGAVRILVAGILLASTLWEDPGSTAALPDGLRNPPGVMHFLARLPGYEALAGSAIALEAFGWLTSLVLLCAMIGWKSRLSVPLGAILYLLLGGWLRQYAWFYHTGLIPLYLLAVLSFLPSGEGLSLDRLLRRRGGDRPAADVPSRRFGWARYAVWTALALPYVAAGLSKLRNGGLTWWDASNFKYILFQSVLRPMEFDFQFSLGLASAPDWLFEAMAIAALLGELLYALVLVSRRARWVIPIAMLLMHLSILFLQNILFFDLILLQAIYWNFRPLLSRLPLPAGIAGPHPTSGRPGGALRAPQFAGGEMGGGALRAMARKGRRATEAVLVVLTVCWVFRVEYYPLTAMQMFSSRQSEPLVYEIALARTAAGDVVRAPIEDSIGAMSDSRYRRVLQMAFDEERQALAGAVMEAVVRRWNDTAEAEREILSIEIQRWEWLYLAEPSDPDHGRLTDRVVYSFDGTAEP